MNKRRLLKLADLLEKDANNPRGVKFDLNRWSGRADGSLFTGKEKLALNCNTNACAVGIACLSGAFARSGLKYRVRAGDADIELVFGQLNNWDAVQEFWGLSYEEAKFLFSFDSYPGRLQRGRRAELAVAKRIRDFVAGKASPAA